jgi:nitroimidazol reductase NimA-like FMN-containing flavoprotein (pyridoxamine 5'-phosphate oxidase superfamily)
MGGSTMAKVSRKLLRLTDEELRDFLQSSKFGRLATANAAAEPHITPLGFVFYNGALYFHALREGRRGRDLAENPKVAFLVDDGVGPGETYRQRRGAILYGRCVLADDDPLLDEVRRAFMLAMEAKSVGEIQRRTHSWYRIDIERKSSWDFRKIPAGTDWKADRELHSSASPSTKE